MFTGMFSTSITIGAMATMRLSPVAAAIHVVQPRFDTPFTTNRSTALAVRRCAASSLTASMALSALLAMGKSRGHDVSPVFWYW